MLGSLSYKYYSPNYNMMKRTLVLLFLGIKANCIVLNPFSTIVPLLHHMKAEKNLRYSDIFRGYRNIGWKWVKDIYPLFAFLFSNASTIYFIFSFRYFQFLLQKITYNFFSISFPVSSVTFYLGYCNFNCLC